MKTKRSIYSNPVEEIIWKLFIKMTIVSFHFTVFLILSLVRRSTSFVLLPIDIVRTDNFISQRYRSQISIRPSYRTDREIFKLYSKEETLTEDLDNLKVRMKKEGKLKALWNRYGALYFQVWFCIYLPFLLTFFYVLDNNLLQASAFESLDPKTAVLNLCTQLESIFNDPELMSGVRENPRATNFATAYLLADLVPTTVFALAVVTFITKRRDKAALDLITKNEGGSMN